MIAVLITTGKKPGAGSRKIARALHCAVPLSVLEGRGARSLESLVNRAQKLRHIRLCAIHRHQGAVASILFLSILGDGGRKWLSPGITVKSAKFASGKRRAQSRCLCIRGPNAAVLSRLLSPFGCEGEPESEIFAGSKRIVLKRGGVKLAELGVEYG